MRLKDVKQSAISDKKQRLLTTEAVTADLQKDLCIRTEFFLLSSPINHLTTPQIYLVTLWRGPTPRLGTTGLNQLTVYKVF